jgi:tetratricopeptide (TPR) repeat protein
LFGTFSPDGSQFLHVTNDEHTVGVWDLRALRRHLADLGLDWDAEPYPAVEDDGLRYGSAPLDVRIIAAEETMARRAHAAGERQRATALLKTTPDDPEARYRLGNALYALGEYDFAVRELGLALDRRPDHESARLRRGEAFAELRRWDEAFTDADQVVQHGSSYQTARYLRAEVNYSRGRPGQAVDDLTALLARSPGRWSYLDLRAACYAALGDQVRSRQDREAADNALQRADTNLIHSAAWQVVREPSGQRETRRALQLVRDAVRREPNNGAFRHTLAAAQYRSGEYQDALTTLTQPPPGIGGSTDPQALFVLAMCQARLGHAEAAAGAFDRALAAWHGKELPAEEVGELEALRSEAERILRSR